MFSIQKIFRHIKFKIRGFFWTQFHFLIKKPKLEYLKIRDLHPEIVKIKGSLLKDGYILGEDNKIDTTLSLSMNYTERYIFIPIRTIFLIINNHFRTFCGLKKNEVMQEYIFICPNNVWSANYYHWIVEICPAIVHAYRNLNVRICCNITNSFQRESLLYYGVNMDSLLSQQAVRSIKYTNFIGIVNVRIMKKMSYSIPNGLILSNINYVKHNNSSMIDVLFVSRRLSGSRFIINEDFIVDALSQITMNGKLLNIKLLYPENEKWIDQLRIFSQSSIIIGSHGAGLSNIIFAHNCVSVIELTNWQFINNSFKSICDILNIKYSNVTESGVIRNSAANLFHPQSRKNFIVTKSTMLELLDIVRSDLGTLSN